jgi:hypothetical protein
VTGERSRMRGGYSPLHAAAANGSTGCLQANHPRTQNPKPKTQNPKP